MRLLLFIPVFVLFLSNVPFIQTIPLEQAMCMMNENENCGRQNECSRTSSENVPSSCTEAESDFDQDRDASTLHHTNGGKCCQKTETTCICISCFQFAAPLTAMAEFQFNCFIYSNPNSFFVPAHVIDKHIGAPWQPPDVV